MKKKKLSYAQKEYGVTDEELERFEAYAIRLVDEAKKAGKLKLFTGSNLAELVGEIDDEPDET